ncbi:MAG: response regulator [Kiritimatiellae bacterium]|nr:response regulator [Kiritimatiellia bacterium]MDD3544390.1 response regulator [Kiritimatiellia bacterium]MDD4024336.1 response regulator [Kiritimatiellia bacterium]MDD4621641.1 response regulator [Kiritimatiellia bacterium]
MSAISILIVDDNADNLYLLRSLLCHNGYELQEAANGAEALVKARENRPDLIITDILMPVMDGFTFCRECKKDTTLKSVPIIFYTATYTEDRDRDFALSIGASRFIVKPEDPAAFMTEIRQVLKETPTRGLPETPHEEEAVYLKKYSEALIRKLEARSEQLNAMNIELIRQLDEREQAEKALRESERRYRMIFDNSMDAILLTVTDGRILAANPAACNMFGREEREIVRKGRDCILDTADPRLRQALEIRARTGRFRGEINFKRSDGAVFPADVSCVVFKSNADHNLSCMVIRDMSEHKRMDEERDRQLDELRRWQAVMIDNSERNQALKREINTLLVRLGEHPRYPSQPKDL